MHVFKIIFAIAEEYFGLQVAVYEHSYLEKKNLQFY